MNRNEDFQASFESVMIIDDNLIDIYIVSRMITKNNFGEKVLQYTTAIEALKYLQENQDNISMLPNVIFVDIYMPAMSGFDFMVEYDKLPASLKNHCKVYIISSSKDANDIAQANADKNILAMEEKPVTKEFLNRVKFNLSNPSFQVNGIRNLNVDNHKINKVSNR